MRIRQVFFILLLVTLVACGSGGGSDSGSPPSDGGGGGQTPTVGVAADPAGQTPVDPASPADGFCPPGQDTTTDTEGCQPQ